MGTEEEHRTNNFNNLFQENGAKPHERQINKIFFAWTRLIYIEEIRPFFGVLDIYVVSETYTEQV